jgi:hypothetical protein
MTTFSYTLMGEEHDHPAVVAQKAATVALLAGGRFTLGLGAGELLDEHVVGQGWPPVDVRHEMPAEAIEICRSLWRGGYQSFRGEYFTVEDDRVFDLPDPPVPIAVAATETVTPEHLADSIPAGPDVDRYVDAVRTATDAGFERVAFVQIGDDQEGWFRFWTEELALRLGAPTHEPAAAGA